jgi:hypothetical protein
MSRFITPDTIVPNPYNPQSLNRYSYCLNNPLSYIDPSGHAYADADEWAAYMAILAQAYSLYQIWPQMGLIMLHDNLMGFDQYRTGFEVRAIDRDTMILAQLLAGTQSSGSAAAQATTQTAATATSSNTPATDTERFHATLMINSAIAYYGINTAGTKITYNPDITQEGLCWKNGRIEIGPSAFLYGFGWLGSTIAHEAEVHYHLQAKNGIWASKYDSQGIAMQEVQAYNYELANADRFGLSKELRNEITYRRNYHLGTLSLPNLLLVAEEKYSYWWPIGVK